LLEISCKGNLSSASKHIFGIQNFLPAESSTFNYIFEKF